MFEQITPEEVRRFSGDKTVAEAGLAHGSILLFRSAQPETTPSPSPPQQTAATAPPPQAQQATSPPRQPKQEEQKPAVTVPPASTVSSVVPFNTAAAAAAAAAMAAHATVTHAPEPAFPPTRSGGIDAAVAAASAATSSGSTTTAAGGKGEKNAPGWDGGPAAVVGRAGSPPGEIPVVMDPAAQRRATCLALFQVKCAYIPFAVFLSALCRTEFQAPFHPTETSRGHLERMTETCAYNPCCYECVKRPLR